MFKILVYLFTTPAVNCVMYTHGIVIINVSAKWMLNTKEISIFRYRFRKDIHMPSCLDCDVINYVDEVRNMLSTPTNYTVF